MERNKNYIKEIGIWLVETIIYSLIVALIPGTIWLIASILGGVSELFNGRLEYVWPISIVIGVMHRPILKWWHHKFQKTPHD